MKKKIKNIPGISNSFSLNGKWKYLKDASEKFSIEKIRNYYDNKKFSEMSIPVNWQLAGLNNFNGSVWFIKEFSFPEYSPSQNPNLTHNLNLNPSPETPDLKILRFFGVDYFAEVWLNWNYLGKHEGYFQPFHFYVNGSIKENQKNILIVKVTSPFEKPGEVWPDRKKLIKGIFSHHDCRPGGINPKYGQDQNTGGIWNNVALQLGYKIFIQNLKITSTLTENLKSANLLFNLNYFSSYKVPIKIKIKIFLYPPSSKKITKTAALEFPPGLNKISFSINIKNPELWWSWDLGEPNLYKIILLSAHFEEQSFFYGIRKVFLDEKKQFFLNDKKLFLRGTNIIPEQFLSSLTKKRISNIVSLIKEANINIVRVHAHVNRKEFYEQFDRQGILLWQDFSLQWTYDESNKFKKSAQSQIKDMVNLLYNYCSISFWCCHNEPGNQINSLDKILHKSVLQEDKSRIIRTASNYEEHAYDGWYWGKKEHYAAAPMGPLVTEFGAQALPSISSLKKFISPNELFPPEWKTWQYHNFQIDQTFNIAKVEMEKSINSFIKNSQKYQSDVLLTAIDFYRRKKFNGINGIFQFMFIDCWPSITWSVVDYYGKKKLGYETLKKAYQPLYVSVNLLQETYFKGKKINFSVYIINDLYKEFDNCNLIISIDRRFSGKITNIHIKQNDLIFFDNTKLNIKLPENIKLGKHKIILELKKNNKNISQNSFEIDVVKQIG